MTDLPVEGDYARWLSSLKSQIQGARARAALSVNQELVRLYHRIGMEILERQRREAWGAKVIDRLSRDLREAFPEMKGLSSRNLKYMKAFADVCPDLQFGQQAAAQMPWFHIVTLLTQISDGVEREWYAVRAVEHAWSRATLEAHIKSRLHLRQGAALTNFGQHLPRFSAKEERENKMRDGRWGRWGRHGLTSRVREVAEGYGMGLLRGTREVERLVGRGDAQMKKMGAVWK